MSIPELTQQRLAQLCETRKIPRFSCEEMVELLEDGEEVAWILEQALPDGPSDVAGELGAILAEIAAQVAPPEKDDDGEDAESVEDEAPAEAIDAAAALAEMELPPGVDRAQFEQLMSSPRGALVADFGMFCEEKGFSQDTAAGLGTNVVDDSIKELHDEWMETPRESLEGKRPKDVLDGGLFPEKVATFRREAPKVGRNDPCPCGSGKKYKKCCG
jgi:hypothetical protein